MDAIPLLRKREDEDEQPVGFVELFFDLVFVLAVTQLAVVLAKSLTLTGLWQTGLLFAAVWWLWLLTSWAMNWLEPERVPVRLLLFALMLAGLALSALLPTAFKGSGVAVAVLYVAMQLGRTLFTIVALRRGEGHAVARNFWRMGVWLTLGGVFWLIGGFADPKARLLWWSVAVAVDLLGPALGHYVPRLGRTHTNDWDIVGGHLSERCALFIIIALGEVIIVLGQAYSSGDKNLASTLALVASFIGSTLMWWIYFDTGAKRAMRRLEEESDPARIARIAYTYLHLPIVAGIVLIAVTDKLVLAAPLERVAPMLALVGLAGPALFLIGVMSFKTATAKSSRLPRSHLAGLVALAALAPVAPLMSGLALVIATGAVLAAVAALEYSLRSEPSVAPHDPHMVIEVEG